MVESYKDKHSNFGKDESMLIYRGAQGTKWQNQSSVSWQDSNNLREICFQQASWYRQEQVSIKASFSCIDTWSRTT